MDPYAARELDRKRVLKDTRIDVAAEFSKKPLDSDSLTTWAGILLELSQFGDLNEATELIEDAMSKLHSALTINPTNHKALWYLGKAHRAEAYLNPDLAEAEIKFDVAFRYFIKAVELSPENEDYRHSLEICAQHGPEMHKATVMQAEAGLLEQLLARSGASSSVEGRYDFKCDLLGGVILAVGLVAWIVMTKSSVPPPPSR